MTFEEVLRSFPNGLHDALLRGLRVDYGTREVRLQVEIDMRDENDHADGLDYRPVNLLFSDVAFVSLDLGTAGQPFNPSRIDAGEGDGGRENLPRVPDGYRLCWVYVEDVNGFIHIAAREVTIESD